MIWIVEKFNALSKEQIKKTKGGLPHRKVKYADMNGDGIKDKVIMWFDSNDEMRSMRIVYRYD